MLSNNLLDYSVVKEPAGVRQWRIQPAVDTQPAATAIPLLIINFWFNPFRFIATEC